MKAEWQKCSIYLDRVGVNVIVDMPTLTGVLGAPIDLTRVFHWLRLCYLHMGEALSPGQAHVGKISDEAPPCRGGGREMMAPSQA